ncbi:MAG TPA: erythromycin esterase family protein [Herpetosiphonaceae bacterium]
MSRPAPGYATLSDWIAHEAIPFAIDAPDAVAAAVDTMIAALDDSVELLGFGEALHGGEALLLLRNRLFQRLVEAHGYSAIAIESSFPRGQIVNEYIAGRGPADYTEVEETGFSHRFGQLDTTRELVEWMRDYNADPAHDVKLRFYGCDSPTDMIGTDSPRTVLYAVLDYLAAIDGDRSRQRRERIDALIGSDADWENPAASMDPSVAVGQSAAAVALRIETEELISELQIRRPELIARSDTERYLEALHYATTARQLLNDHAVLARESEDRISHLLGIRDVIMADNLAYMVARERGRGKVLAFTHNRHLQQAQIEWQLGPHFNIWWPAGAHLRSMLGPRYVVVGSALGVSEANGIEQPEPGTLEALLAGLPESAALIPTHQGRGLPASEIAALPIRSGSTRNPGYAVLEPTSFNDFDWLVFVDSTTFSRGWPELP